MNESGSLPRRQVDVKAVDYEPPKVFDLGSVRRVTSGDEPGASDENGWHTP
ncbi:lasso RiPP family leader peptide-containing protein [Kibdelosporangium lantanae]|uniref:Lasso RiPP family leader peptide-containing protein n=1 Tax=Kibdelosporangium lantanae TaxID=1497396 RepID=A0ABW3M0N7_9PSEU